MIKIIFDKDDLDTLKSACDIVLRNNGINKLKEIYHFVEKLDQQSSEFSLEDIKLIQNLCDISLKTAGIAVLKNVVDILNKTSDSNK